MHLQIVVPFLQLTWNGEEGPTCQYVVETIIPTETRYHLVEEENQKANGNQEIKLSFYLTDSYNAVPLEEGITHVMRKFKFGGFLPPSGVGDAHVAVEVNIYDEVYDPGGNPGEPAHKKKGKMRLEDAEIGVDPVVHY